MQLYLLGMYEIFGMEEIVDMQSLRAFTVVCSSTTGTCYTMPKDHFQDIVNQFHFSDSVIDELLIKH